MLDDLFNFPLHRVERMIGAVHDAVGPRPYDRFAEKGQPADAGAVHVDIVILLCDLHHLPDAFDQPRMAHDDGELAEISGHFAEPLRTCILPQAAVKENDQAVVLSRLHERIDLFFVVGRAIFDQGMNLYPFEPELDPFLQNLERILWTVSGTQPHEAVNASRVLFHSAGNVLVGLPVIRRLPYPDGKSNNPIYPGAIHRTQHVLRHEFHDRRNLVDGKLLSRPHVGVRVNDLDAFSFNSDHSFLLKIKSLLETILPKIFRQRRDEPSVEGRPCPFASVHPRREVPFGGLPLAPKAMGPLGRLLRPPKAMGQWVLWTVHVRCFGLAQQPPSLLEQSGGGGSKDRCTRRGGSSVSTVQRTRTLLHRA